MKDGATTLGFRAEDAKIVQIRPPRHRNYSPALCTRNFRGMRQWSRNRRKCIVAVKADKEFRAEIGSEVHNGSVPPKHCHLFDSQTGERLGG